MVSMPESNRFSTWVALMVFSAIALGALADHTPDNRNGKARWALAVCCISMILSFLVVLVHFAGDASAKVIGEKPEQGIGLLILAFWCGGLATIQSPDNGLGVAGPVIANANLYFFSWGSFLASLGVVALLAQEQGALNLDSVRNTPPNLAKWYLLCATSIVVFAVPAELIDEQKYCDFGDTDLCKRTRFAIAVGVIVTVFSMLAIGMTLKGIMNTVVEAALSFLSLGLYCFGVAYITSASGPGNSVGNLYFATWIGFVTSFLLFTACVKAFMKERAAGGAGEVKAPESPVEEEVEA